MPTCAKRFSFGEARGVILLAAAQAGLHIAEYNPTQIKTAVVGYGEPTKHKSKKRFLPCWETVSHKNPKATDQSRCNGCLAAAICYFNTHR